MLSDLQVAHGAMNSPEAMIMARYLEWNDSAQFSLLAQFPALPDWMFIAASMPIMLLSVAGLALLAAVHRFSDFWWRRQTFPKQLRRRRSHAGIRLHRHCWTVLEGSGYEVHHERHPGAGTRSRHRFRSCWSATCVTCGVRYRDSKNEVAHFDSTARVALTVWENGWTIAAGEERCEQCSRLIDECMRPQTDVSSA